MPDVKLAFDRKSARSFDADGRMRVKDCILSTAEVNPYRGQEIPGWDKLGLKANAIYELYRTPEELQKAVATFEGIPLMLKHIPQTAEAPRKEYQAGSVHTIRFDGKHLRGDLLVTDGYAIELIQSDEMSDLSCGYRYDPVMQSGEADGSKYDGRMQGIQGNHVALVDDGRATGAHVADSAMRDNPQTPDPSMQGVDAMPFPEKNEQPGGEPAAGNAPPPGSAEGEMNEQNNMAAIGQALKHIAGLLENIHARLPGGDTAGADRHDGVDNEFNERDELEHEREGAMDEEGGKPTGELPPENEGKAGGRIELTKATEGHEGALDEDGPPMPDNQEGTPARGEKTPHGAMDAKTVNRMIENARKDERARMARVEEARREVRGVLGEVYGMDSANKIYREALKQVGVDVAQVAKGAEQVAWNAFKVARGAAAGARPKAQMAMDGKDSAPAWLGALNKISVKG